MDVAEKRQTFGFLLSRLSSSHHQEMIFRRIYGQLIRIAQSVSHTLFVTVDQELVFINSLGILSFEFHLAS